MKCSLHFFLNFGIAKVEDIPDEGEVVEKQGDLDENGESVESSEEENQEAVPEDISSEI